MKYGLLLILASIPAFILVMLVGMVFGTMMRDVIMGVKLGVDLLLD